MSTSSSLPPPGTDQAYWTVSTLAAGYLDLHEKDYVAPPEPGKVNTVPSLSFLLRHSASDKVVLFDLGLRKDWEKYTPYIVAAIKQDFNVQVPRDVAESLRVGGLEPRDIKHILLSHLHFDHLGDPSLFPNASFIVGAAGHELLGSKAYPTNPLGEFHSDLLPFERTRWLEVGHGWASLGPFPAAHDLFGDGSLYVVDAPGHLPGHVNVLVRNSADGAWILLSGDTCHDPRILSGTRRVAVTPEGDCAHEDRDAAEKHIALIRAAEGLPRVRVMLAHQPGWDVDMKATYFPGHIPSL